MLASRGSSRRRPKLAREEAEAAGGVDDRGARAPAGALGGVAPGAVTPGGSKAASSTRCSSRTSAPDAAACRSSSSSNSARGTCHVWGARTSRDAAKSAKPLDGTVGGEEARPHFAGNPRLRTMVRPRWPRGRRSRRRGATRRCGSAGSGRARTAPPADRRERARPRPMTRPAPPPPPPRRRPSSRAPRQSSASWRAVRSTSRTVLPPQPGACAKRAAGAVAPGARGDYPRGGICHTIGR